MTLIAAIAQNGAIGKDNQLLWRLPDDLKSFKALTTGHWIMMGRKTFDSLGKPLPNRTHVVISRSAPAQDYDPSVIKWVKSFTEGLKLAEDHHQKDVYVIGGGQIYEMALPYVTKMVLTYVHQEFAGDVFFPSFEALHWREVSRHHHPIDDKHLVSFDIVTLEKRAI